MTQIIDGDEHRKLNWIQRIGKTLSARWSKEPPPRTTTVGIAQTDLNELYTHFFDISTERKQVYDDMDLMDDTVDEFAQALDVLADHAVMGEFGEAAFQVASKSGDPLRRTDLKIIESLLERTQMREKMFSWTRDCIKYGDEFLENVIGDDMLIHRLMHLPPKSMRRHETPDGLLQNNPDRIKKTGYAFTQVTEDGGRVVAAFLPFQITHLRWRRSGGRKYGRPQGYTARVAWRKLQALEEALVMNWLTRAFARLLFIIDTTGLAPAEAQKRIRDFQTMLQTTDVGSGKLGVQNMSIVKDIFIGKQFISDDRGEFTPDNTDAKVLDTTSSAFWNMNPIEYYQNKIVTSMGVPKGHLGIERDINAKATLVAQDRAFARRVRQAQSVMSQLILDTISLQYALLGRPLPEIKVEWTQQASEDVVDRSQAVKNIADAAETLIGLGAADVEFVWQNLLRLSPSEQASLRRRLPAPQPVKGDTEDEL